MKPNKPYDGFPLFPHASGQWAKKIRGRTCYFGGWSDPTAALDRYLAERDDLYAGRAPQSHGLTVRDLCNRFLASKQLLVDSGELSPRTWRDHYEACRRLTTTGRGRLAARSVSELGGADFEQLRAELALTLGPVALGAEIQRVRSIFGYAFAEGLIGAPVRFGSGFAKPSRKVMRRARRAGGEKLFAAADVRRLVKEAEPRLRAMILLAVNCGFGQSDLAHLPATALDLKTGWVEYPRPKTESPRRAKLWPETVRAVRAALEVRHEPADPADDRLVFLTRYGRPWVRTKPRPGNKPDTPIDAIGLEFRRLLKRLGLFRPGLAFYALRHTYRTIADGCLDQRAVDYTMGHVSEHISSRYVERIEDARLDAVAAHVRKWLFGRS